MSMGKEYEYDNVNNLKAMSEITRVITGAIFILVRKCKTFLNNKFIIIIDTYMLILYPLVGGTPYTEANVFVHQIILYPKFAQHHKIRKRPT